MPLDAVVSEPQVDNNDLAPALTADADPAETQDWLAGLDARAFLADRLTEAQLANFRKELAPGGGLSSYPHPWLMPDFWQFPTVSMGLGPLTAIYQARFNRYLHNRGIKDTTGQHVWCF